MNSSFLLYKNEGFFSLFICLYSFYKTVLIHVVSNISLLFSTIYNQTIEQEYGYEAVLLEIGIQRATTPRCMTKETWKSEKDE